MSENISTSVEANIETSTVNQETAINTESSINTETETTPLVETGTEIVNPETNSEPVTEPVTEAPKHANVKALTAIQVEFQLAERLTKAKYSHLNIVPDSLRQELAHPIFGNKRYVQVICQCGCVVDRATSDLHTFKGCQTCKKAASKAEKTGKKLAILEALAAIQG